MTILEFNKRGITRHIEYGDILVVWSYYYQGRSFHIPYYNLTQGVFNEIISKKDVSFIKFEEKVSEHFNEITLFRGV